MAVALIFGGGGGWVRPGEVGGAGRWLFDVDYHGQFSKLFTGQ